MLGEKLVQYVSFYLGFLIGANFYIKSINCSLSIQIRMYQFGIVVLYILLFVKTGQNFNILGSKNS
ncbi:MAG: hypothetical protein CVU00_11980 [Bacteroidetes bacterium HGW-Bacteroidetes-17]|nr:MAG: hypothetical protein CVU00_11980 [Bacteroidetes bacterium HGW-Bacteroidetes-17]